MDANESNDNAPNPDSIVDVLANLIGVLIIVAMVMGVRAARPQTESASAKAAANVPDRMVDDNTSRDDSQLLLTELEQTVRTLVTAKREIEESAAQAAEMRLTAEMVDARRLELNMLRSAIEKDLAERRSKLDVDSQSAYDVQVEIDQLQRKLDELTQQQLTLSDQPDDVEQLECMPTPLARTITGDEIHVRLRGRRLALVPVDALLDEVRSGGVDYLRNQLSTNGEGSDMFGPIDGFRMRLSLSVQTHDLPGSTSVMVPARRSVAQMAEFLPTRADVGQDLEQALLPAAPLMQALRAPRANRPAVVLWVYPDSYGDIRTIKRVLWEASVPLAVRPLDKGDAITFSTQGTKSQAQ